MLQAKHRSRVVAAEMRFLRCVCGVTCIDRVRNVDVLEECGVEEDAVERGRSCLRWFGHVERMSSEVCKKLYESSVEGKRPRGTPRKRWLDQVKEYLREK